MQQCDACPYRTNELEKMAEHKASKHAMVDFYCNICEYTARTPYVLHRHKVEFHGNLEEARYHSMQQIFLTGLAAQVDNLMEAVILSKDEVLEQLAEVKAKNVTLEVELDKTKKEFSEVKEALQKSNAFSNDMQHDSKAIIKNVVDKCSKLEVVAEILMKKNEDTEVNETVFEVPKVIKTREVRKVGGEKKHKVAWVGTSISKQLDRSKFKEDLNVDLVVERAYCIEDEVNAHFRSKNFRAVVPDVILKDDIDTLVLQTGSIEITNLEVNKTVMDTKKHINEHKKQWFEKVERDSTNLFNIAEDALKRSATLKKVIIIKRLPRYDRSRDDILGIKSQLSEYANNCYDQLWIKKGCPDNIFVVQLNGLKSTGYIREIVYGKTKSKNYDGIHLRGPHAVRHFSYRAVQAIKSVIVGNLKPARQFKNKEDNHRNCPQAVYQSQRRRTNERSAKPAPSQSDSSDYGHQSAGGSQGVSYSDVVSGNYSYNVPTQNKFNPLN